MRITLGVVIGALTLGGVARAQPAPAPAARGYVEAVGQSAFGNVTSQSFGAEAGVNLRPNVQVFLEGGHVNDTSPATLGEHAQVVAGYLASTESGVSFRDRQPVDFALAGLRVLAPQSGTLRPYVLGGAGLARVSKNVGFSVGGQDVTAELSHYGVVLGSDLAGSEVKPTIGVGGGVLWQAGSRLVLDFQYRYGRVLTSGQGLNVNRAGLGVGLAF